MIYRVEFSLDSCEFKDRLGVIRSVYGCSLLRINEFWERIKWLTNYVVSADPGETIGDLYLKDEWFAFNCDRALELNGIDPDWVNAELLAVLLFAYEDDMGVLVKLNKPKESSQSSGREKEASEADLLSALWSHTKDLKEALDLAEKLQANTAIDLMTSKVNSEKEALKEINPEQYQKMQQKNRVNKSKNSDNPAKIPLELLQVMEMDKKRHGTE